MIYVPASQTAARLRNRLAEVVAEGEGAVIGWAVSH